MSERSASLPGIPWALVILLSFLIACSDDPDSELPDDPLEQAEANLKAHVDMGRLSGVATRVLQQGDIFHQFTYGMENIEEGRPLDEESIYRIYSMSKPITAAALMILYDEGKFQLDDPVEDHIPVFKNMKVWEDGMEVEQVEPFTVRHLLTHTAGFTYGWEDSYVDSKIAALQTSGVWDSSTLEELMVILAAIPLKHQPGTTYEYSISLDVAGYLVEVLSGQTFDNYLQENIFDPLGMDDTGFQVPEEDFDRLAMIYTRAGNGPLLPILFMTNGVKNDVVMFSGGGGLASTVGDYRRFCQMLLNGGELDGMRVLQESSVDLIMSDQMPEAVEYETGYGLGGYVDQEEGAYGWGGAASTEFVVYPRKQVIILAFTQYFPTMGVKYTEDYKELVWQALE